MSDRATSHLPVKVVAILYYMRRGHIVPDGHVSEGMIVSMIVGAATAVVVYDAPAGKRALQGEI
jgi:hypothetical protein